MATAAAFDVLALVLRLAKLDTVANLFGFRLSL